MQSRHFKKNADTRLEHWRRRLCFRPVCLTLLAGLGLIAAGPAGAKLSIATVPLYLSAKVKPNVMLEFDNSGSMANLNWASGYNPSKNYTNISPEQSRNGLFCDRVDYSSYYGRHVCRGKYLKIPQPLGNSTRYATNYLNYLFQKYPSGTDLTQGQIPDKARIQVAKQVAKNVVNNNTNLRFGLSAFNKPTGSGYNYNGAPGGSIIAPVGSSPTTIDNAISQLDAATNTPLAETFYEITRYFRGLSRFQGHGSGDYNSPIQYRCQKNFVIAITDGLPTYDATFPRNDPDDPNGKLANWDGKAPRPNQLNPPFPQFSDGFLGKFRKNIDDEGDTLFLDDLALFAHDIDLSQALSGKQSLATYAVGFTVHNQMLKDTAQYGDSKYFTAYNANQLSAAVQKSINDIVKRTSSASNVASDSSRVRSNSKIYQARFISGTWSGQLLAYDISNGVSLGSPAWDAANKLPGPANSAALPAGNRTIYTYESQSDSKTAFQWTNLNTTQQGELNTNTSGTNDGRGPQRLEYLRGRQDNEAPNGLKFRPRPQTVLGDIVHSSPVYVGAPPAKQLGNGYQTFRRNHANRTPLVYVGANDGMLHAFHATIGGSDSGEEAFAYVPNALFAKLSDLTAPTYNTRHEYFVDGQQTVQPARFGGGWHTVLVGTLGAGGKGVYALDVTDGKLDKVLWEFTAKNHPDLGDTISSPSIVRLQGGRWAAVFGNGYNSSNGHAVLYIVDIQTGVVIKKIDTGAGGDNGLASPSVVDVNNDQTADYIYAGDLHGNLWKFNVKGGASAAALANGRAPFFVARGPGGARQPITEKLQAGLNPQGGIYLYFGTGRYFENGDATIGNSTQTQSFYGVQDKLQSNVNSTPPTRSNLLEQEVKTAQPAKLSPGGIPADELRVTTDRQLQGKPGWFLDLPRRGERQVSEPVLRSGRVIFTTKTPNSNPCSFGGTSSLYELNALNGARLNYTPFDVNNDNNFNKGDYVTLNGNTLYANVRRLQKLGLAGRPTIVSNGDGTERKYLSGSSGNIQQINENTGAQPRLSWRQIK